MAKRALVTGGAGFIGSHLVERLLQEGWGVRVLDNCSTGSWGNLYSNRGDLELVEGDIRDRDACHRACRGVDSVFHLAAIASVATSVTDPMLAHDVNVNGTLNMLLAARDQDARRFVLASSAAVYGNAEAVPTSEDQPIRPQSPYATGKATGELYCRNFWELFGLETVALRFFNVFGPRQCVASGYAAAIPKFVQAAVAGEAPVVYGDGQQTRDFVFVADVVSANIRAAMADQVAGRTFNVAGGKEISLLCLLSELEGVTGARLSPEFRPARPGEVRHSRADISHARRLLGYEPAVPFASGIRLTVEAVVNPSVAPASLAAVA